LQKADFFLSLHFSGRCSSVTMNINISPVSIKSVGESYDR
jgi:hypothetical protein